MFISKSTLGSSKPNKEQVYKAGYVLPVLSAKDVLSAGRYQGLIRLIRDLSGLREEPFHDLYLKTLQQFAEFVQVLPAQHNGTLSSLFNQSLAQAVNVLQQFCADRAEEQVDPLLNFAIFTAGLFADVAKVVINQKLVVVDEQGEFIRDWNPFAGPINEVGDFYKIYQTKPIYQRLEQSIRPLLARQIISEQGFLWISSDLDVLADWLDALNGDGAQGGKLTRALSLVRQDDYLKLLASLTPAEIEQMLSESTQLGESFLLWLKNGIDSGDIKVNTADANVHIVDEGVFIEKGHLFKQFAELVNQPTNMHVVFTQFGNLFGIAKKGGMDFMSEQYFSKYPEKGVGKSAGKAFGGPLSGQKRSLRSGMVLADPSLIFMKAQIPATTPLLKASQPKGIESHLSPPTIKAGKSFSPKGK